jgi:site-specific DNA-cytosine methylase
MYVVDLFCGCGGFSTGASMAGHEIVLAIDFWDRALVAHKHNHPDAFHQQMSLGGNLQETKELILKHVPDKKNWHLHGSPPCQNLSVANRTAGDAKEGMRLVYWYIDLVKLCAPTSWSMEQVIGARHYLESYNLPQFHIINTSDYLIPQTRKRLFIGAGWTLPPPLGTITLSEKLPNLKKEKIMYVKGYSNTRSIHKNGVHLGNVPNVGLQGFRTIDEPTFTLCAAGPLGLYDAHQNKIRSITIDEALRIQGFPSWYKIPEELGKGDGFKLVGNAVAPPIAYLIMKSM